MNDIQATLQQLLHTNLTEILLAVPTVFLLAAVYGSIRTIWPSGPKPRKVRIIVND